jgi:Ribonuclease H2 non-catalytic subunit (Ylr154p-like)
VDELFVCLKPTLVIILLYDAYVGHVFRPIDSTAQFNRPIYGNEENDERDDEEDGIEKVKWESNEKFDSLTMWEHHALPDKKQDHWIRGIEEWVQMADVVPNRQRLMLIIDECCRIRYQRREHKGKSVNRLKWTNDIFFPSYVYIKLIRPRNFHMNLLKLKCWLLTTT